MAPNVKRLPSWALDSKLTPADKARGERDERNTALVDERHERALKHGPTVDVSGAGQLGATTFDEIARPYQRGVPIVPLDVKVGPEYPGGFHYILRPEDFEAVRLGYACERCLADQPSFDTRACPTCEWPRDFIHKDRF